eukprot:Gb_34858 [translate_table: standard]
MRVCCRELICRILWNCKATCSMKCQEASFNDRCIRACGTCCAKCNCVPPGITGNKEVCPCYANMKTHGEGDRRGRGARRRRRETLAGKGVPSGDGGGTRGGGPLPGSKWGHKGSASPPCPHLLGRGGSRNKWIERATRRGLQNNGAIASAASIGMGEAFGGRTPECLAARPDLYINGGKAAGWIEST